MLSEKFIIAYTYKKGITFLDGWQRIDNDTFEGDCDDFALTVLILEEGGWLGAIWALLTFKACFWLVHSPSNFIIPRHVVLHHRKLGWIDSTERTWRNTPAPHRRRLPLLAPWAFLRMAWGAVVSFLF